MLKMRNMFIIPPNLTQNGREWMGIEPTRSRASDPSTALKAAGPDSQPPAQQPLTQSPDVDWWAHWRSTLADHPDLAAVVAAWPDLPEPIRAGILAMVKSAGAQR